MQIIELLTPHYEVAWLPWAVQYFFLVGVATGAALLVSLCVCQPRSAALQRLLPVAVLTLAVSAMAAPVSLLADLHQPARFWHFTRTSRPGRGCRWARCCCLRLWACRCWCACCGGWGSSA